jgi:hypothetical protein
VAFINPLEFTRWTTMRSHELWERIQAPSYDDRTGRDAIGIVYLDEPTLAVAGLTRPIKLRDHEAMLDDVVRPYRPGKAPEAVLIDFALDEAVDEAGAAAALKPYAPADLTTCDRSPASPPPGAAGSDRFRCYLIRVASLTHYNSWSIDPWCSLNDLARIFCIRRSGGVPIVFVSGGTEEIGQKPSPAMTALSKVALVASADVSTSKGYWLADPDSAAAQENQAFKLSPAAMLYTVFCLDRPDFCKLKPFKLRDGKPPEWTPQFDRPLDVVWGLGKDDAFTDKQELRHIGALQQRCIVAGGSGASVVEGVKLLVAGLLHPEPKTGCAYTHTTPYSDLDEANMTEADLDATLKGKLVLIGGQFSDSNDWVPSPLQGQLPGIHYHAMALDNLIHFNANYQKIESGIFNSSVTWSDVNTILYSGAILFIILAIRTTMNEPKLDPELNPKGSRHAWAYRISCFFVGVVVLTAPVILVAALSGLAPANFNLLFLQDFNMVMFALLSLGALLGLFFECLKPVAETVQGHRVVRFLHVENVRWCGPDVVRAPMQPKIRAVETQHTVQTESVEIIQSKEITWFSQV